METYLVVKSQDQINIAQRFIQRHKIKIPLLNVISFDETNRIASPSILFTTGKFENEEILQNRGLNINLEDNQLDPVSINKIIDKYLGNVIYVSSIAPICKKDQMIELAMLLSNSSKVILIDLSNDRALSLAFSRENLKTLDNFLNNQDVITNLEKFDIIKSCLDMENLLLFEKNPKLFINLVEQLKSKYEYILINGISSKVSVIERSMLEFANYVLYFINNLSDAIEYKKILNRRGSHIKKDKFNDLIGDISDEFINIKQFVKYLENDKKILD